MSNELDILTLLVKKEQFNTILENYQLLGWQLAEQSENKRYEDLLDVKLTRPHKIENKDDLQLLQIYLEDNLNTQAKLKKFRHAGSTVFSSVIGVLGLAMLTLGILFALSVLPVLGLVGGIVLICVGVLVLVVQLVGTIKIAKREKVVYKNKLEKLEQELNHLRKRATDFFGGEHGK